MAFGGNAIKERMGKFKTWPAQDGYIEARPDGLMRPKTCPPDVTRRRRATMAALIGISSSVVGAI
jgi:hypothetical protein